MHDTSTRSPARTFLTADPTSSTVPAGGDLRNVSTQNVEVGAADRHGVDADDRIGVVFDLGIGNRLPSLAARPVVHECLHRAPSRPLDASIVASASNRR